MKIQYVIAIQLITCQTNFYDFRFKWTATAAIGIHPTKAWLSQLVNFKNAIWTFGYFRRTICKKLCFKTWKKCHRNVRNASDCFWGILHESSISFLRGIRNSRYAGNLWGMMRGVGGVFFNCWVSSVGSFLLSLILMDSVLRRARNSSAMEITFLSWSI